MDSDTDRDFIPRKWHEHPRVIWILLFVLICVWALFGIFGRWESSIAAEKRKESPFFQVTNREFSLFLYQNPEFMRAKRFRRFGYLSHFSSLDDIRLIPALADENISSPPDILFRYHVWHRLLGESLAPRPILGSEYKEFLEQNPEWLPEGWPAAPEGYQELVQNLSDQVIPPGKLPLMAQFAFQGWNNFFNEWKEIEAVRSSKGEMETFLVDHPDYGRSYWRNIISPDYPDYLKNLDALGDEDLPDFLKVGIYNYRPTTTKPSE